MRRFAPILALLTITTTVAGADASECPPGTEDLPEPFHIEDCGVCELPALPSLDCSTDKTCCTSGALDVDADPGATSQCDEAIAFAAVEGSCPDDWDAHVQLFSMNEWSWEDNGLRSCDNSTPFGRHWVAATFLAAAIDSEPGKVRHNASQYLMAGQANSTDFHPQLEHRLSPGLEGFAMEWQWDGVIADTIRIACRAFEPDNSAEIVAGMFIHEAWHSVYGLHDVAPVFDDDTGALTTASQDHYYAHEMPTQPTRVGEEFNPDAWTTNDNPGEVMHSVYQIQHEFLCDAVRSPRNWVPRAGLFEAVEAAASIVSRNTINQMNVPSWALCSDESIPLRTQRDPELPDGARRLDIELEGLVVETSEDGSDDDTQAFAKAYDVIVLPDNNTVVLDETIGYFADGEVWLELDLDAVLGSDGETVSFTYNLLFYEADEDGTDCDEDLGGDDCPAKLDPSLWASASVDSLTTFYLDHQVLDNASNENGTDVADITMNVELSW